MSETTSRRGAALVGAGIAAASLLSARAASAATPVTGLTFAQVPGTGDVQVLNYALALEDLESDLYRQALGRLTTGATSGTGTAIPGLNLPATQPSVQYLTVFGTVEAQHRDFLRKALGYSADGSNDPVLFKYDFGLQNLDEKGVVDLIYAVEATGVAAYLGAIPKFTVQSPYLQTAASIQATEARHTATVAILLNANFGEQNETAPLKGEGTGQAGIDTPLDPDTVLGAVTGGKYQFIYSS